MLELFNKTLPSSSLNILAKDIVKYLLHSDPFHLHLLGELGAGKTTLMRYILQEIGLDKNQPVNSPTFSYMYEYEINGMYFAHLDLYRIEHAQSVDVLDLLSTRNYRGVFTEWPQMAQNQEEIAATHVLNIDYIESEIELRKYKMAHPKGFEPPTS